MLSLKKAPSNIAHNIGIPVSCPEPKAKAQRGAE